MANNKYLFFLKNTVCILLAETETVNLGKLLNLFTPQFPNLQNKDNSITFPIGFALSTK